MFKFVKDFEDKVADFYGAPYAVATDSCTHAIELCLRHENIKETFCPKHTYISIPMTLEKLGITWFFTDFEWSDYYCLGKTRILDAAVFWRENSYIRNSLMCLSFQYQKHLSLGRGGAILCADYNEYIWFKKASYDGRLPDVPWAEQDIDMIGYHYYMTPEVAAEGIRKLDIAIQDEPRSWTWNDYPDLSKMSVFQ